MFHPPVGVPLPTCKWMLRRAYRGASLIRNTHPARITIGP